MPDIKTKSPRNTSTKVNSRINNHYSGPLKSVGPKDSAVVTSKGGKFRTVCEEHQTGTTGSPTAENVAKIQPCTTHESPLPLP